MSILKIAIPTFCRNALLEKTMHSLAVAYASSKIPQLATLVDIYVYDNNINKDVINIIEKFTKHLPNLHYVHNGGNIGASLNILKCYSVSNSKFVHVLGDDDLVMQDYFDKLIPRVMEAIFAKDISLIYIPSFGFDNEDSFVRPFACAKSKIINKSIAIENYNIKLTFISSLVVYIDTVFINSGSNSFFPERLLVQLVVVLRSANLRPNFLILSSYLVAAKRDNAFVTTEDGYLEDSSGKKKYNDLYQIYVINYYSILNDLLFDVSYKHRYLHFNRFILWEMCVRDHFLECNPLVVESYFGDLWVFKILVKVHKLKKSKPIFFIISSVHRVLSFEFIKILFYLLSTLLFKFKKLTNF
jgi:hypothetical protein